MSTAVHRFEELIGGHPYLIEVAAVATDRWRACIVRIPGGPIALMPFYGPTPDEAAERLRQWLTRAHELASGGMAKAVLPNENPREAAFLMPKQSAPVDVTETERQKHVRLLNRTTELREEHEVLTQKPFDKAENAAHEVRLRKHLDDLQSQRRK